MARMINYGDDELLANPFAFAAQAPVAPAMLAPVAQAPVAPVAAPRRSDQTMYSQTQEYGMVPVYEQQGGRAGERGEPVFLGYEYPGVVDVPKPASVLELEKKLGTSLGAYYNRTPSSREGQGEEYGPPIGYAYDNGQGQNVLYDASGAYKGLQQKRTIAQDLIPLIAAFALPFIPGIGGLLGGGAEALGTAGATLGSLEGGLTAAELASLPGAATGIGAGTAALTIPEFASLGSGATLGSLEGGLTAAEVAGLPSLGTTLGASEGALTAAEMASLPSTAAGAGAGAGLGTGGTGLLGETAALGAGEGLTTGGAGASGMGGGTGLTATLGTDLAGGGALTAGNAGLATMGGGTGLTALSNIGASAGAPLTAAGLGLTSMGGGTGLTTAAAGGGTVGAGGVIPAGGTLVGSQGVISGGTGAGTVASSLPSLSTIRDALTVASLVGGAVGNNNASTAAPFTMAPYVPPSGKPFANLGMSPIATPYTPTRIAGQYDPTKTPGGISPYELIMAQMQAPKNLYADFEAGTNIGGYDPQRFVVPPAAAATAPPNNMGGMINKSRMVGPNPMGPDNGFASIQDGEFVMNRKATQKYGIELMNAINSGKISKGKLFGLLEA